MFQTCSIVKVSRAKVITIEPSADAWKKGLSEEAVAEELVDVIFYVLDASRLACPSVNMDEMFREKLEKNRKRPH
jgi:NTP pyrophosphatase (non-canonical NTP hydrolase)